MSYIYKERVRIPAYLKAYQNGLREGDLIEVVNEGVDLTLSPASIAWQARNNPLFVARVKLDDGSVINVNYDDLWRVA